MGCHKLDAGVVIEMVSTASDLAAVANAEGAAFDMEAAFRAHYARVARLIARVVGDAGRAEELAVEVFLKLWRNPKAQAARTADGPGGSMEGWLYRVALRKGLDELRKRGRRERYEKVFGLFRASRGPATPEQLCAAGEEQEKVRRVLAALPARQSELLILRSQGLGYREMASVLGWNAASVGTLLARAQDAFRKEYVKRYGNE
jgi:RNA polymerase sigma-70 factor (ECF subfamily)